MLSGFFPSTPVLPSELPEPLPDLISEILEIRPSRVTNLSRRFMALDSRRPITSGPGTFCSLKDLTGSLRLCTLDRRRCLRELTESGRTRSPSILAIRSVPPPLYTDSGLIKGYHTSSYSVCSCITYTQDLTRCSTISMHDGQKDGILFRRR